MIKDKDPFEDILRKGMLELKDESFTEKIVEQHLQAKMQGEAFSLRQDTFLVSLIAFCLVLSGSCLFLVLSSSHEISIGGETIPTTYLILLLLVSFIAVLYKFLLEVVAGHKLAGSSELRF